MPYKWSQTDPSGTQELHLWAHESLSARGMVAVVFVTFVLILIPVLPVMGTVILWGLLPFLMLSVWALYAALQANHRSRQISECLTLDAANASLVRRDPSGQIREWRANRYWTRVRKYDDDGPVPHYVTLKGEDREVEIGAFLSEEERLSLYEELNSVLRPT